MTQWLDKAVELPCDLTAHPPALTAVGNVFEGHSEALHHVLDASVDCIKIIECDGTLRHLNLSSQRAFGLEKGESFVGLQWLNLLPKEVRSRGRRALQAATAGKRARFAGKSVLPGRGVEHWENVLTPVISLDGSVNAILCVSRNVTAQREIEKKLKISAAHDALTGLPNRKNFLRTLQRMLTKRRRPDDQIGLLVIDLDYFKQINHLFGHEASDLLLCEFSDRLKAELQGSGIVARIGGDEFAIATDTATGEDSLTTLADKLSTVAAHPFLQNEHVIKISISIGGALSRGEADRQQDKKAATLLKNASLALQEIKSHGRGGFRLFRQPMTQTVDRVFHGLRVARDIVDQDTVQPAYQRQVDLLTGKTVSYEVLLRWSDRVGGALKAPGAIADAFHDYHLATRLAFLMRKWVFRDAKQCLARGGSLPPISINASPVEFMRDDFAETFLAQLDEFDLPPGAIAVEVTEQGLIEPGPAYALRALRLLKDRGVSITLDDFGKGYSSFSRLLEYPFDGLKIDHAFVKNITLDASSHAIVDTIVSLGERLSLTIVAEGVETKEQSDMLTAMGCRIGQGYYFSPPEPAATALRIPPC